MASKRCSRSPVRRRKRSLVQMISSLSGRKITMGKGELTMVSFVATSTLPVIFSMYLVISRRRLWPLVRVYSPRISTTTASSTARGMENRAEARANRIRITKYSCTLGWRSLDIFRFKRESLPSARITKSELNYIRLPEELQPKPKWKLPVGAVRGEMEAGARQKNPAPLEIEPLQGGKRAGIIGKQAWSPPTEAPQGQMTSREPKPVKNEP